MKYLDCGPQVFTVPCPKCHRLQHIPAEFDGRLTADSNGGRLALKMSTKSLEHNCTDETVLPLFPEDQT